jgi:hypothetical protein
VTIVYQTIKMLTLEVDQATRGSRDRRRSWLLQGCRQGVSRCIHEASRRRVRPRFERDRGSVDFETTFAGTHVYSGIRNTTTVFDNPARDRVRLVSLLTNLACFHY